MRKPRQQPRPNSRKQSRNSECARLWDTRERLGVLSRVFVRDPDDLRKFARQDWTIAKRSKEAYWVWFHKRFGAAGALWMVDELRRQVIAQKPNWPSEEERREDYETHMRVIDALERVSRRRREGAA